MRPTAIIQRYLFFEMIPPFAVNLVFFTFIFLMTKILDIANMIVNYRVDMATVFRFLLYAMPFFLIFVIPIAVMMAVLLTFLRMSNDNEIVALKSGGVSLYALLPPVVVFCLLGCAISAFMAIYANPWGRSATRALTYKAAASLVNFELKERAFNDQFDGVMLYVNHYDVKRRTLIDVFIEDKRQADRSAMIVAPKGRIYFDEEQMAVHLALFDGMINRVDLATRSVQNIRFDKYDLNLDLKPQLAFTRGNKEKDEEEMSLGELRHYLQHRTARDHDYFVALTEFHRKFSVPFACLALGVLAVPLGVQLRSAKRSFGLGFGLFFFLAYYLMLSAGWILGEAGVYPPVIGLWVPNVVLGGTGVYLLIRAANERPAIVQQLIRLVGRRNEARTG